MALFLLPVHKYGHVSSRAPCKAEDEGRNEAPPGNSISGTCGQGCWSQEGRGTKCKWESPFPENSALVPVCSCSWQPVGCVDEMPLLGEHPYSWGLSSSLFSWSLILPPVQSNGSIMVSIWSKAGPRELKQRNEGSLQASKRCQPCSVPIQPHRAGLL